MSRWKAEIQFEARDCNSFLEVIVFVNSFNQILRIYWNIHQWCIKFSLNPGYAHVDLCSHTINNFFLRQTNFRLLSPEKINFIIFFPYVNLWYIIFHLLSFFFFFRSLTGEYLWFLYDPSKVHDSYRGIKWMYCFSNQSYKRLNRDRGVGSYYFKDFFESKFFPPKNLDKYEQLKDACVTYYLFCK